MGQAAGRLPHQFLSVFRGYPPKNGGPVWAA